MTGSEVSDIPASVSSVDQVRNSFIIKPKILCALELTLGLLTFIGLAVEEELALRLTSGILCLLVSAYTYWAIYKIESSFALLPCMIANVLLYSLFFFGGMVVAAFSTKNRTWSFEYMAVFGFIAYTLSLVIGYITFLAIFAIKSKNGEAPPASLPMSFENLMFTVKSGGIVQILIGVFTLIGCADYPEMWVTLAILDFIVGAIAYKFSDGSETMMLKAHMFFSFILAFMYAIGVTDACDQAKNGCKSWVYPFATVTSFLGTALQVIMLYYLYRLYKAFKNSDSLTTNAESTSSAYNPSEASAYTTAGVPPTFANNTTSAPTSSTSYGGSYGSASAVVVGAAPAFANQPLSQAGKQALSHIQETAKINDYYHIFGVSSNATLEVIAQKRRELNQKLHPDNDGENKYESTNPFGSQASEEEERKLAKINNIYTVVFKRQETKELYDTVVGYRGHYQRFASEGVEMLKVAATNMVGLRTKLRNANFPSEIIAELDSVIAWIRTYRNIQF